MHRLLELFCFNVFRQQNILLKEIVRVRAPRRASASALPRNQQQLSFSVDDLFS
jgi:hypothetical protein